MHACGLPFSGVVLTTELLLFPLFAGGPLCMHVFCGPFGRCPRRVQGDGVPVLLVGPLVSPTWFRFISRTPVSFTFLARPRILGSLDPWTLYVCMSVSKARRMPNWIYTCIIKVLDGRAKTLNDYKKHFEEGQMEINLHTHTLAHSHVCVGKGHATAERIFACI